MGTNPGAHAESAQRDIPGTSGNPKVSQSGMVKIIQNNGNVKKMAAFMQYWQVHHPQQPGVPTPKIQFFESKNQILNDTIHRPRWRSRSPWICWKPLFLHSYPPTGWLPVSSNIIIGHTTCAAAGARPSQHLVISPLSSIVRGGRGGVVLS